MSGHISIAAFSYSKLCNTRASGLGVERAVFSPDGTRIVTASQDKTARLWEVFPTAQAQVALRSGTSCDRSLGQPQRPHRCGQKQ
jgi:WD40 repeat protein